MGHGQHHAPRRLAGRPLATRPKPQAEWGNGRLGPDLGQPRGRLAGMLLALVTCSAVVLGACAAGPTPAARQESATPVQSASVVTAPAPPSRVFLIVMENHGYEQIIGNPQAPYINDLARAYASADNYFGVAHPSLPNYLALIAGDTFVKTNCTDCLFDASNLGDQIEARGKTWKSYQEDLPSPCFLGTADGKYALRHNPFLYFPAIRDDPARCQRVVPLGQLTVDLQSGGAPDLAFITPNLQHDMHDGSVAVGDAWLATFVPTLLSSDAWRQNGVLFIVWDENSDDVTPATLGCCGGGAGGHVALLSLAPGRRPGYHSTEPASHYNLLRTIADVLGVGYVGHSADADVRPMSDLLATS